MTQPRYTWLLFDADNTLFDFQIASQKSFIDLIRHLDIGHIPELYTIYQEINAEIWHLFEQEKINGQQLRSMRFERFFDHIGYSIDPVAANLFYLNHLVVHSAIYDTTIDMLDRLQPHYKMAIITNGLKEVQRPRITKLGLDHYFDTIVVSDEIGVSKPNASYFNYTFRQIGNPAKGQVLIIGDSLHSDIKGGLNYGVDTCWYNPEKRNNLTEIKPTYQIDEHSQLFQIL